MRNRADVDFDRRRRLLADHRLNWFPEEIKIRQLESLERNVRILVVQLLLPQFRELVFRQKRVEQSLDRLGGVVARTLLAAAEFS